MMNFEADVRKLYADFFNGIGGVCLITGKVKMRPEKRFATFPYIGSEYGKTGRPRILFVGMDIGRDETVHDDICPDDFPASPDGRLQSVEERQKRIMAMRENQGQHNGPHLPGTCNTAADYLEMPRGKSDTGKWPLQHVALTNFHKFVRVGREYRENKEKLEDREWILGRESVSLECRLLADEVNALGADIVIFQSLAYRDASKDPEASEEHEYRGIDYKPRGGPGLRFRDIEGIFTGCRRVLMGPHPSARGEPRKKPIMPWRPWA